MTPLAIVNAFIAGCEQMDLDTALELVADDVEYHNMPIDPVFGPDGIRQVLTMFMGGATEVEWVVHREACVGNVVFNERTDRFLIDGRWVELPVVGVWDVRDGKITRWRDYFDLATVMNQMPQDG
jgi:limonene-1,2-epoxide hydrolase